MANESVKFKNLPGVYSFKNDGNLTPELGSPAPRTVIIGTAGKGRSTPFLVPSTAAAKSEFGTDGTIYRGMWEAKKAGAPEIMVVRIGATPAILQGVGSGDATGYKIETVLQDDTAGASYEMYYTDLTDRLVIRRVSDSLIIFDNDPTFPIDRFEVIVSGNRAAGAPDLWDSIGDSSTFVALEDVTLLSSPPAAVTFVAGTDGVDLSRMEMYQELFIAYRELMLQDFDVLAPMDIYLDDFNVVDQGNFGGAVVPELPLANTYPTAGAYTLPIAPGDFSGDVDSLGKVYVEEYQGEFFFWWLTSEGAFTAADIFPAVDPTGTAQDLATLKIDGTALTADDFHEVNFAYQLGRFLYEYSTNIVDATGVIGVLPPNSASLTDKARWLGKAPVVTINNQTGIGTIADSDDNGYGLLGNKFMAGRDDHRAGAVGGGFVARATRWLDSGEEFIDDNDIAIDLGKYLSVVADYPLLRNNFNQAGYIASYAASYAGLYVNRNPASAPTNKPAGGVGSIIYKINLYDLDDLVGAGFVALRQKPAGIVVADAPTAALPNSDWSRLSTVRIVQKVIEDVRAAAEPFLGESLSQSKRAALENAIEQKALVENKKAGYLKDYGAFAVTQTPDQQVQGRAEAIVTLMPAFELRQLVLTVNLSKSG